MPICRARYFRKAPAALVALWLGGCAVGPDYQAPHFSLPDFWRASPAQDKEKKEETADKASWWRDFNDPVLDALMAKALAQNLDLRSAAARLREARAYEGGSRANLLPTINGSASYERSGNARNRISGLNTASSGTAINTRNNITDLYQAGFDASWEIDLFGRLRRRLESSRANREAAEADTEAMRLSVAAEVARVYLDYRLNATQRGLAEQTAEAQTTTARITEARYRQGVESRLELSRATAQLETTRSEIPRYDALAGADAYRLDLLLGENPGSTQTLLTKAAEIPFLTPALALEPPLAVIQQRPDLRAAERRLASATALHGAAIADMYPTISLSGAFGYANRAAGNLLRASNETWSLGPNLLVPLIDFGKLRAQIDIADAQQEQAMLAYESTVRTALQEVETSALAYLRELDRHDRLQHAMEANEKAMQVAQAQYREGILSQLDVLDAQRSLYASQLDLAQSTANVSTQLVALYKALGRTPPPEGSATPAPPPASPATPSD